MATKLEAPKPTERGGEEEVVAAAAAVAGELEVNIVEKLPGTDMMLENGCIKLEELLYSGCREMFKYPDPRPLLPAILKSCLP